MKKTIAFVLPSLNAGGAQRVVSTLANALILEYNVCLIVSYECKPFYKLNPDVNIEYCQPDSNYRQNPNPIQSLINNFRLIKKIIHILKNYDADIAIGFMPVTNIYTIIATKFLKIPNIISERANPRFNSFGKFWTFIRRIGYRYADCLVVQTKANKEYFKNYVKSSIEIINNPLDLELLEKRNLQTPKENIVLNVGRLAFPKNQDLLIRAFSNIDNANWKLILVGDGKNFQDYKILIDSLNMQDKIILAGNSQEVHKFYNTSKIFAFTSQLEGFPNALIEAMYYGLACISTDCPNGPSEIIKNNYNGVLIPVSDQNALEENLSKLMQNVTLQNAFSKKAVETTIAFHPMDIALQWTDLINNMIDNYSKK